MYMKNRSTQFLTVISLALCLLLASCDDEEETLSPVDDPNEGLGGDITQLDTADMAGIYTPEDPNSEWDYLDIHDDGTFVLSGANATIDGYLGYDADYDAYYAYEDEVGTGSLFTYDSDGTVTLASYGSFYESGLDNVWYEDDQGNSYELGETETEAEPAFDDYTDYYTWNAELYQRNVCDFAGIWYYDGDLAADSYIEIDDGGSWSLYQRAPGAEAAEMDHGTFSYSTTEASTYYADSTLYDGVSYRVFELDKDVLIWGEEGDAYYLME